MQNFDIKELVKLLNNTSEREESVFPHEITEEHANFKFDDLGFDSLAILNFLEDLKQEFELEVEYDDVIEAQTPAELLSLIQKS